MSQWFYAANGGQAGPVETAELKALAAAGSLRPDDLVWKEGLADWVPASKIKGLFGPTLPPAPAPDEVRGSTWAEAYGGEQATGPQAPAGAAADAPAQGGYAPAGVIPYVGGSPGTGAGVTQRTIDLLRQTKPWVLLFSVLMFIGAGLTLLGGLMMVGTGLLGGRQTAGPFACMSVIPILFGLLYFMPALYLARYAGRIGSLATSGRVDDLEGALEAQKSFWKFVGVLTLLVILFYILIIVMLIVGGVLVGGAASRGGGGGGGF